MISKNNRYFAAYELMRRISINDPETAEAGLLLCCDTNNNTDCRLIDEITSIYAVSQTS